MKSPIKFFAAAAVLLATATVTAQVYRWVDKDGKVQYSDQPPPPGASKADPKKVSEGSAANAGPAGTANPQKSIADQAKDFDKRRKDQAKKGDEQAKKDEEAKKLADIAAENCAQAREMIRNLESGRPIARANESGESYILSDEQRQNDLNRARDLAGKNCK